jgi:putative phosphoesterase
MRLAILSDIHSNPFALRAVMREIERHQPDLILCAGDVFGYYPWARETFELLQPLNPVAVLGNHDRLVLETLGLTPPGPASTSRTANYEAARQNGLELSPAAREWLHTLPLTRELAAGVWRIKMFHGTPDDPMKGRLYPDDQKSYPWFPQQREILILGHTHYPLFRKSENGGLLLNPGSVGQPRQGDPRPTWIILEIAGDSASEPQLLQTPYNQFEPIELLKQRNWPLRFIAALNKTAPGLLSSPAP